MEWLLSLLGGLIAFGIGLLGIAGTILIAGLCFVALSLFVRAITGGPKY